MRRLLVGVVTLAFAGSLEAQVRDSTYWMIGAARSFMDGQTLASRGSQSGGSMQFEWRTEGKRLGVRTEVGVAQQNRYFDEQPCAGCFSDQRRSQVMALTSAVFEFRQEHALRPYVIGGAGLARFSYRNRSNFSRAEGLSVVEGPELQRHPAKEETSSQLGFVTAYGFGLSLNSERFGTFAEARGRTGSASSGIGERFSLGVRVRP